MSCTLLAYLETWSINLHKIIERGDLTDGTRNWLPTRDARVPIILISLYAN